MIDLCIVNFNTQDKLKRLLDTLRDDHESGIWNLYIADNGSTDDSERWLRQDAFWHYNIGRIEYNKNIGYANACNQLAALGSSDVIGLLNADVWLTTQDVKAVNDIFAKTDFAVVGPKQRDEEGRITHAGIFGFPPQHRGWRQPDPADQLYLDTMEASTVSGSAYFIRRTVWQELTNCPIYQKIAPGTKGAFLPTDHYHEEEWCSVHARAHGHKVVYTGMVSIGHSWHASAAVGEGRDGCLPASQEFYKMACKIHEIPCHI